MPFWSLLNPNFARVGVQAIFLALKGSRQLRKHHLYLLISVYARALDFSACEADLSLMLQLGTGCGSGYPDIYLLICTKILQKKFSSTTFFVPKKKIPVPHISVFKQ